MHSPTDLLPFENVLARATPLSPQGHARRAVMQQTLVAAVVRRRRTRRAVRIALVGAALLLGLRLAFLRPPTVETVEPALRHIAFSIVRDDAPLTHLAFTRVTDDATATLGWRVPSQAVPADMIVDDAQLLHLLANADRPTGLVRRGAHVFLTANVVDARPSLE